MKISLAVSGSLEMKSILQAGESSMTSGSDHCDDLLNESRACPVRIYTLGEFKVICPGGSLSFSRKVQPRPLLLLKAILALGGANVSEATLTNILCPDDKANAAHDALTRAIHRLRRLLGCGDGIIRRDHKINLDASLIWVDAWAVERLLQSAEQTAVKEDLSCLARIVRAAIELYKGSFLAKESNTPWAQPYASRLRRSLLRAVIRVGKNLETEERPEDAARWFERAMVIDDCAEDACRGLMKVYQRLGRPAEALHAYQQCRAALNDIGLNPSVPTEALLEQIVGR